MMTRVSDPQEIVFDPFNFAFEHNSLDLLLSLPQESDVEAVLDALNDPRVYTKLEGPPFPYTRQDYDNWGAILKDASDKSRQEWDLIVGRSGDAGREPLRTQNEARSEGRWMGEALWVSRIREVVSTTSGSIQRFVGEITLRRSGFNHLGNHGTQQAAIEVNEQLPAGHPDIVWEVGFYLVPAYHGKGIMPVAFSTLMQRVLVPYLNVHTMIGTFFEHNLASKRVFEKCGFHFVTVLPDAVTLSDVKVEAADLKEKRFGLGTMRWERRGGG